MPNAVSDPAEPGEGERKMVLNLSTQSTRHFCRLLGGLVARGGDAAPGSAWGDAEAVGRVGHCQDGLGTQ